MDCMGYTNVRTSSNLQIEIMVGHLRNVALLLCAQRSSRHKNCRIGGLMFDSIIILQLQTVFYPGYKYCIFQAPTLGKKILLADKSDNHVLYDITSQVWQLLSMVWVHRQGQWKGKYFSLSFLEKAAKKLCVVFSDVIFYPHVLQKLWVS